MKAIVLSLLLVVAIPTVAQNAYVERFDTQAICDETMKKVRPVMLMKERYYLEWINKNNKQRRSS